MVLAIQLIRIKVIEDRDVNPTDEVYHASANLNDHALGYDTNTVE